MFSFEVFQCFWPRCQVKEEEGGCWRESLCFQPLPPPLLNHPTEVLQQGQKLPILQTDYLGKGLEESQ